MQRREGLAKLTGRERYVDDLPLENFLWGMTVRSPAPRGRIAAVRFAAEVDCPSSWWSTTATSRGRTWSP